jgi:hypothetical protein
MIPLKAQLVLRVFLRMLTIFEVTKNSVEGGEMRPSTRRDEKTVVIVYFWGKVTTMRYLATQYIFIIIKKIVDVKKRSNPIKQIHDKLFKKPTAGTGHSLGRSTTPVKNKSSAC